MTVSRCGDEAAVAPAQIASDRDPKSLRRQQSRHRRRLGRADLDRRHPARRDQPRELRGDDAVIVEAVGAGEQRAAGLMIADLVGKSQAEAFEALSARVAELTEEVKAAIAAKK